MDDKIITKDEFESLLKNHNLEGGNYTPKEKRRFKIENDLNDALRNYFGGQYKKQVYKLKGGGLGNEINISFEDKDTFIDFSKLTDEEFQKVVLVGGESFLKKLKRYFKGIRKFNEWVESYEKAKNGLRNKVKSYNLELKKYESYAVENAKCLQTIFAYSKKIIIMNSVKEQLMNNVSIYRDDAVLRISRNRFLATLGFGPKNINIKKGIDKKSISNIITVLNSKRNRYTAIKTSKVKELNERNRLVSKKLLGKRSKLLFGIRGKSQFDEMMKQLMSSVNNFNRVSQEKSNYAKFIVKGKEYKRTFDELKGVNSSKISKEQAKEIELYKENKETYDKLAKFTTEYFESGNQLAEDRDELIMKIENYKLQFLQLTKKENTMNNYRLTWEKNVEKAYEKIILLQKISVVVKKIFKDMINFYEANLLILQTTNVKIVEPVLNYYTNARTLTKNIYKYQKQIVKTINQINNDFSTEVFCSDIFRDVHMIASTQSYIIKVLQNLKENHTNIHGDPGQINTNYIEIFKQSGDSGTQSGGYKSNKYLSYNKYRYLDFEGMIKKNKKNKKNKTSKKNISEEEKSFKDVDKTKYNKLQVGGRSSGVNKDNVFKFINHGPNMYLDISKNFFFSGNNLNKTTKLQKCIYHQGNGIKSTVFSEDLNLNFRCMYANLKPNYRGNHFITGGGGGGSDTENLELGYLKMPRNNFRITNNLDGKAQIGRSNAVHASKIIQNIHYANTIGNNDAYKNNIVDQFTTRLANTTDDIEKNILESYLNNNNLIGSLSEEKIFNINFFDNITNFKNTTTADSNESVTYNNSVNSNYNMYYHGFSEDINLASGATNTKNNYRFGLGITRGNLLPDCFMLSSANVHKGIPTFYGGDLNISANQRQNDTGTKAPQTGFGLPNRTNTTTSSIPH